MNVAYPFEAIKERLLILIDPAVIVPMFAEMDESVLTKILFAVMSDV